MTDALPNESELLTVAFSLHSNPGAYALLLGAGVSAPSGIPTAWGVLEDLVARTADLAGAAPADAVLWYQEQFGEYPTYEGVLERIAPTQIERQRQLRGYFEQSPDDVEVGRKVPTPAHRAIAKLVRSGAVRIILTLNFDHLIEQALRAEGIEPTIIASPADVEGMAPLHMLDCCVIHLHGDYLNPTTMLNTVTELKAYHPSTSRLLQRILEDYGLIVAGWSSKYDPALRDAIATHYPNRFTLTWFEPARPSDEATTLRTLKRGVHITQDADMGFGSLADGVVALANRRSRHPLTIPVALETAKRELSGRTVAIGLHDRLRQELDALHRLPEFHLVDHNNGGDYESMLARIEEATRLPAALLATLTYWGNSDTDSWWIDELPRFATPVDGSGLVKLLSLRVVSGSILFYAAGVSAVARGRFDLLGRMFALRRPHRHSDEFESLASSVDAEAGYEGAGDARTRLFDVVSPLLADALSLGIEPLDDAWQLFEVLRLTWVTRHSSPFDTLQGEYAQKDEIFEAANSAFDEAQRRPGAETSAAQTARAAAWQERDRVLGRICRLAPVGRPHILTADNRGDERYQSVTATRLAHDLSAERAAHPTIASGLLEDVDGALLAVKAVSTRLGMIGSELSWDRVRGVAGIVPSQMWIDSGQTPQERTRGTATATTEHA
ncbi:TPA: SIR2 family protein [Legionella pneumophila]|nr:SIR2 family protein [Legionella pneumophila]